MDEDWHTPRQESTGILPVQPSSVVTFSQWKPSLQSSWYTVNSFFLCVAETKVQRNSASSAAEKSS